MVKLGIGTVLIALLIHSSLSSHPKTVTTKPSKSPKPTTRTTTKPTQKPRNGNPIPISPGLQCFSCLNEKECRRGGKVIRCDPGGSCETRFPNSFQEYVVFRGCAREKGAVDGCTTDTDGEYVCYCKGDFCNGKNYIKDKQAPTLACYSCAGHEACKRGGVRTVCDSNEGCAVIYKDQSMENVTAKSCSNKAKKNECKVEETPAGNFVCYCIGDECNKGNVPAFAKNIKKAGFMPILPPLLFDWKTNERWSDELAKRPKQPQPPGIFNIRPREINSWDQTDVLNFNNNQTTSTTTTTIRGNVPTGLTTETNFDDFTIPPLSQILEDSEKELSSILDRATPNVTVKSDGDEILQEIAAVPDISTLLANLSSAELQSTLNRFGEMELNLTRGLW